MKNITLLFCFLFTFLLCNYSYAQEYNKVKIITMPDGTRKAVIVKEGEEDSSKTKKPAAPAKQNNSPVHTQPQNENRVIEQALPHEEESYYVPAITEQRTQSQPDPFWQDQWNPGVELSYRSSTPVAIAAGYEVIPYGGFSDYKHNANVQLVIRNVLFDGFIGGFGKVTTIFEEEMKERTEDKCTWGVNLGYKIRLNERFDIYPVAGVFSNYEISDDLSLNYGIGMHYRITSKLFLNYKVTRYTASLSLGFYIL